MRYSIFVVLLALPVMVWAHKFYVSIAEVDRKPASIQLAVKLFTDDLEDVLQKRFELDVKVESDEVDSLLGIYMKDELKMWVADSLLELNYIGKEIIYDVTWAYVEFPYAKSLNKLKVENSLLFDLNEEQANIFNLKDSKGYVESYMFTRERKTHTYTLNE